MVSNGWAYPDKTILWSYNGHFYRSESKAMIEYRNHLAWHQRMIDRFGEDGWWNECDCPKVYKIKLQWELV